MSKSDYSYTVDGHLLRIVDLNKGRMSVTNDAENVLTEIRGAIGSNIEKMRVVYQDSDGQWDTLMPTWNGNQCVDVQFRFGV